MKGWGYQSKNGKQRYVCLPEAGHQGTGKHLGMCIFVYEKDALKAYHAMKKMPSIKKNKWKDIVPLELGKDKKELKELMYRIMEERNLPYPDAVKYGSSVLWGVGMLRRGNIMETRCESWNIRVTYILSVLVRLSQTISSFLFK